MNQDFKDRLKKVMEIRGVKQYELALQTEMNKSVINRYCSGTYYPKYPNLIKICKVLKCSPAYLLGESEDYDDFDGLKLANFLHSTTPEINDLESMSVEDRHRAFIYGECQNLNLKQLEDVEDYIRFIKSK